MSFSIPSVSHDPEEKLDYETNWRDGSSPVLQVGEAIATSVWAIDGMRSSDRGVVIASDAQCVVLSGGTLEPSITDDVTKCWVQGGTLGKQYLLRNRITTDAVPSRIHDRSRWLTIDRH
jgi:hypothetical protein